MGDEFDFCGQKISEAIIGTLLTMDHMLDGPFKAGAVTALEEVWFRLSGKNLYWEDLREKLVLVMPPIESNATKETEHEVSRNQKAGQS